jgi:hypothetical protein
MWWSSIAIVWDSWKFKRERNKVTCRWWPKWLELRSVSSDLQQIAGLASCVERAAVAARTATEYICQLRQRAKRSTSRGQDKTKSELSCKVGHNSWEKTHTSAGWLATGYLLRAYLACVPPDQGKQRANSHGHEYPYMVVCSTNNSAYMLDDLTNISACVFEHAGEGMQEYTMEILAGSSFFFKTEAKDSPSIS